MRLAEAVKERADLGATIGGAVALRRKGRALWGCCPFHAEKTPSFMVEPEKGRFRCWGCGAAGDAIAWVMKTEGRAFREAVEILAGRCGLDAGPAKGNAASRETAAERAARDEAARAARSAREAERAADEARRLARRQAGAREMWLGARHDPAALTPYLASPQRRIDLGAIEAAWGSAVAPGGVPASLRFHPACPDRQHDRDDPAMIGVITGPAGEFLGVHRTFLGRDAAGALSRKRAFDAKMMLGAAKGGMVRLTPPGRRFYLTEGIETGLSIMTALARRGDVAGVAVGAGLSLGNIAGEGFGRVPDMTRPGVVLPGGIAELIICEDADNKDPAMAAERYACAAARFGHRTGIAVKRIRPPAGMDFNDLLVRSFETAASRPPQDEAGERGRVAA